MTVPRGPSNWPDRRSTRPPTRSYARTRAKKRQSRAPAVLLASLIFCATLAGGWLLFRRTSSGSQPQGTGTAPSTTATAANAPASAAPSVSAEPANAEPVASDQVDIPEPDPDFVPTGPLARFFQAVHAL